MDPPARSARDVKDPNDRAIARVLLIEDDADAAEALIDFLREEACIEAAWARSGREAMDLARDGGFAAALIDLSLPDMDGADLAIFLRGRLPGARLAAVTGASRVALDSRILGLVDRVFQKPADPEALLAFARAAVHGGRPIG